MLGLGIGICFSTPSSVPRKPDPNPPQELPFETSASSSAPHPRTTSRIARGACTRKPLQPGFRIHLNQEPTPLSRATNSRHRCKLGSPGRPSLPLAFRALQLPQDLVQHQMIDDERDDLHLRAARRTHQRIHLVDPPDQ